MPDPDSFELGEKHEAAAEFGGSVATFRAHDGTVHRYSLPQGEPGEQNP